MTNKSKLEEQLAGQIRAVGFPEPVTQYRLPETPKRRYTWDFAFVVERLLVDVQGGTFMAKGGHNTGSAIEDDCEKLALGALNGYRCLFVTGGQVKSGVALQWIERALGMVKPQDADV